MRGWRVLYRMHSVSTDDAHAGSDGFAAALDTAGPSASFVVVDGSGEVRVARHDLATGRSSADLLPTMLEELDQAGVALEGIRRWTAGMGPGSFTGIRMGAALLQGICRGSDAKCRGLPSSLAMASAAEPTEGERVAVLHDGRRGELIVSRWRVTEGAFVPIDMPYAAPAANLSDLDAERVVMYATDRARASLPAPLAARAAFLPHPNAGALIAARPEDWAGTPPLPSEPVYVRPAVFVPARVPDARMRDIVERTPPHQ